MASQVNSANMQVLTPVSSQTVPEIAKEGTYPIEFYKNRIILIPKKKKKRSQKRERYRPTSPIITDAKKKNPQQNNSKANPTMH